MKYSDGKKLETLEFWEWEWDLETLLILRKSLRKRVVSPPCSPLPPTTHTLPKKREESSSLRVIWKMKKTTISLPGSICSNHSWKQLHNSCSWSLINSSIRQASENLGMAMVYTLVTSAKEWLTAKFSQGAGMESNEEEEMAKDDVCLFFPSFNMFFSPSLFFLVPARFPDIDTMLPNQSCYNISLVDVIHHC